MKYICEIVFVLSVIVGIYSAITVGTDMALLQSAILIQTGLVILLLSNIRENLE